MTLFFDSLYEIHDIHNAFKNVCLDKMLSDGYLDMSVYIYGRIKKEDMYTKLVAHGSRFAVLYKQAFPKKEDAYSTWNRYFINEGVHNESIPDMELTNEESIAIVNWVYRIMHDAKERIVFTSEIFSYIKECHGIQEDIRSVKGVFYNSVKIDLQIVNSISSLSHFISSIGNEGESLFFRGHSDPNYRLRPSIKRSATLYKNESKLYNDLLIECPDDFSNCHTHLEKLVKMQHYGLPTRLLDLTRNLLVALYFACEDNMDSLGELILISTKPAEIKYPQSEKVSILASLPAITYEEQQEFLRMAVDPKIGLGQFKKHIHRLLNEIRLENPAFEPDIKKEDVLSNYIVYAIKNNCRIVKQDGAFILCGLSDEEGPLEAFRLKKNNKTVVVLIDKKKEILEELETFSINRASLFPEIECVAEYIKSKYSS